MKMEMISGLPDTDVKRFDHGIPIDNVVSFEAILYKKDGDTVSLPLNGTYAWLDRLSYVVSTSTSRINDNILCISKYTKK